MNGRIRFMLAGVSLGGMVVVAGLSVDCLSDPRDKPVMVISSCDLNSLDSTPSSPQASVKDFVQAAQALAQAATMTTGQLQQICNDIDSDLQIGTTGSDLATACQPIIRREEAIRNLASSNITGWFGFAYPPTCHQDPSALAECITTCAGSCSLSNCPTANLTGTCPGICTGNCSSTGAAGACNGSCEGTCNNEVSNVCNGECIGHCSSPYLGTCSTGCISGFTGHCDGTCTGTCDGTAINVMDSGVSDAGAVSDSGGEPGDAGADACEGGCPEAGPTEAGPPPPPPPSNADGNCPGTCKGVCSSKASGSCAAPCRGLFSGGTCNALCTGQCVSGLGSGCVTTGPTADGGPPTACDGICTEPTGDGGAKCSGVCQGSCSEGLQNPVCTGALKCNQNNECEYACEVKSALTTTCKAPDAVEVELVSDPQLYSELKKYGPQLAVIAQTVAVFRNAADRISQQTVGDFQTIDAGETDLVLACIRSGDTAANQALATLSTLAQNDITVLH